METIKVESKTDVLNLTVPTSIEDYTSKWLLEHTADVNVSNNYALIAQVSITTLWELGVLAKEGKRKARGYNLFIKCGKLSDTCDEFIRNLKAGDMIITQEIGIINREVFPKYNDYHPGKISAKFTDFSSKNPTVDLRNKKKIYLVNFYLIPLCDIIASYNKDIAVPSDVEFSNNN